jgi:TRAP-type uncharacterized transport system substrate-binding protein
MNAIQSGIAMMVGALYGALVAATAGAASSNDESSCMRIATGPAGKPYAQIFADMRAVCGSEVPLCQVSSDSGLTNLGLLAESKADLGLVQVDVLEDMKSGGDQNAALLQAVLPLHYNLLHIVALSAGSLVDVKYVMGVAVPHTGRTVVIRKFSDLSGLRVAAVGSARLTARNLSREVGLRLAIDDVKTDDEAQAKLRSGAVQAILTLGGKATPVIGDLRSDAGLMLAEFDGNARPPYRIVKHSYRNLAAYNVSFLAVPNLLVTRAFKPTGVYGRRVADLQRCLVERLDELKEGHYSPGWKEIEKESNTYGVPPFQPSPTPKTAPQ